METSSLDLVYLDKDPFTELPSAAICLKGDLRAVVGSAEVDGLITRPCLNFVELDAEIRRLHAELEEIRARARKKFYKAEAMAVGVA